MKIFFRKSWLKNGAAFHRIAMRNVQLSIDKKQQKYLANLRISCFEQQKRILKWSLFGTKQENVSLEPRNTILCLVYDVQIFLSFLPFRLISRRVLMGYFDLVRVMKEVHRIWHKKKHKKRLCLFRLETSSARLE